MKNDRITDKKIEKYRKITQDALAKVRKNIIKGKESQAKEIISMVENYLSDSKYFMKNGNYVDSFAALNYAHGWLDSGVRLDIFDVSDSKLFTIK
jgi:hypothetical protein